jgi:pimeloyl-ACP methyl ester carboxylesterase
MARDLQNLLDHYRLDQAVVAGHSMGALTLWQYLRDFGDSRLALVFIDQSPAPHRRRLATASTAISTGRNAAFIDELETDFAEAVLRLVAFGHNPGRASCTWKTARASSRPPAPAALDPRR